MTAPNYSKIIHDHRMQAKAMTTDPKALADKIESLRWRDRYQTWHSSFVMDEASERVILAALRAPSSAEAMREAAAQYLDDREAFWKNRHGVIANLYRKDAAEIRALPLPDPGSAPVEAWREREAAQAALIERMSEAAQNLVRESRPFCAQSKGLAQAWRAMRGRIPIQLVGSETPPAEPSRDAQEGEQS